ncbi:MAG TPA: type II toxin-antitoxin system RelE/ParE family toxin [Chloroflexota bacterium]|nr:type II toxin-antitoxin system RelE/ParE family toxin [Chloroflexota bacterium]
MKIVLTDVAESDLSAIYAYYAERSGPAADRVLGTILRAINGLARFPLIGKPGAVPETRERVVTRYPYRIIYHIDEAREVVEVWRVLHATRDWPP